MAGAPWQTRRPPPPLAGAARPARPRRSLPVSCRPLPDTTRGRRSGRRASRSLAPRSGLRRLGDHEPLDNPRTTTSRRPGGRAVAVLHRNRRVRREEPRSHAVSPPFSRFSLSFSTLQALDLEPEGPTGIDDWRDQARKRPPCGRGRLGRLPSDSSWRSLKRRAFSRPPEVAASSNRRSSRQHLQPSQHSHWSRLRNSWGWRLGAVLNSPGKHPFALDRRLDAGSGGPAARREVEVGLFRRVADRASEHRWVTDAGRAPRGVAGGALVMSPGVRAGRR